MERLKHLKEALMCCVEGQMNHLKEVDTKELGEAIDMIKDLEEAIYYATITKAMNEPQQYGWGEEKDMKNGHAYYGGGRYPMMYYDGGTPNGNGNGSSMNGGRSYYSEPWDNGMEDWGREHEGRSGRSRRQYMESKMTHKDKTVQMRELEKYMQELSSDILEMIDDASPEEKQYLGKKITGLAEKVNKLN